MKLKNKFMMLAILTLIVASTSRAYADSATPSILDLSLEELVETKVTSVSRHAQKLSEAPAAIFVLTQEDIRRSGATSIPELLRLVPGLSVAALNNNDYAITARGFSGVFANKLLVMIDGRAVYAPVFSGVYWDDQDLLLSTIERIEVIRGPGGTLWGANAVNGVINIITKIAKDTQGTEIMLGGGNALEGQASVRQGGKLGEESFFRVYAKGFQTGRTVERDSTEDNFDRRRRVQGGFRMDAKPNPNDSVTVSLDGYTGTEEEGRILADLNPPFSTLVEETGQRSGGNIIGRWEHEISPGSDTILQLYFDRVVRDQVDIFLHINTTDIDFQHHYAKFENHNIVWGTGFRHISDYIVATEPFAASWDPKSKDYNIWNTFIQDDIEVTSQSHFVLGSKFEHNDFSGFEVQPNARFIWTPGEKHSVWASISRAVRTPSRVDHGINVQFPGFPGEGGLPTYGAFHGDPEFDSESLIAYEVGYRFRPLKTLSFDVATFINDYDDLANEKAGTPEFSVDPPSLVFPNFRNNGFKAKTYGVETVIDWQPVSGWRLQGSYTLFKMDLEPLPGNTFSPFEDLETETPQNQVVLRSFVDLPHSFEFDSMLRYVDTLSSLNIDSYLELNVRLGWKQNEMLEWSITGENLLRDDHTEFVTPFAGGTPASIRRAVFGNVTVRF